MKKWTYFCLAVLLASFVVTVSAHDEGGGDSMTWTGEVVDIACYLAHGDGARGADHAKCAKSCINGGQPMGLLTDDGTLVLLVADHQDGAPYEAAKGLAGEQAEITGTLAERDGVKAVTVTGAKAAG